MHVLLIAIWSLCIIGFTAVMNAYQQPKSNIAMGIPIPVLILIGVTVAMSAIASKHRFGRHVFAMGGSPENAELAGIDTRRLTVAVFVLMGLLCGLASIVITARLNAGASVTGTMTELNVIAAAVIGGTSLAGGVGTVYGAIVGALIMQSLESGMILMGVATPLQRMVLALVLIAAVWIDMAYRRTRLDVTRARRVSQHRQDVWRRARRRECEPRSRRGRSARACSATTAPANRR